MVFCRYAGGVRSSAWILLLAACAAAKAAPEPTPAIEPAPAIEPTPPAAESVTLERPEPLVPTSGVRDCDDYFVTAARCARRLRGDSRQVIEQMSDLLRGSLTAASAETRSAIGQSCRRARELLAQSPECR